MGKHASEWDIYIFPTLFLTEKGVKDKDWQCNSIGFAMPFNTFGNTNRYLLYCKLIPFAAEKHILGIITLTISLSNNALPKLQNSDDISVFLPQIYFHASIFVKNNVSFLISKHPGTLDITKRHLLLLLSGKHIQHTIIYLFQL
ncbi:hypothetical protein HPS57_08180 [Prevotella sp. PINT]|nr:hypothetical protein [Palleniella intestinalis]